MRCLYCGKELPLFKRLRGGEFCSDAHRLSYQEEYTQLALSRLLQANSSGEQAPEDAKAQASGKANDTKTDTRPAETKGFESKPSDMRPMERPLESPALKRRERLTREEAPAEPLQQTAVLDHPEPTAPEPVVIEVRTKVEPAPPEPVPATTEAPEEQPPAGLGGFHIEVPLPLLAETPAMVKPESGLSSSVSTELPRMQEFRLDPDAAFLSNAGPVPLPRSVRAGNYAPPRERGLEEREFVRSPAPVEIQLAPAGEAGLGNSAEALALNFDFHPPKEAPAPWQESARDFPIPGVVFEESARLDFESSGWGDGPREEATTEEDKEESRPAAPKAAALATPVVLAPAEPAKPRPVVAGPVSPSSSAGSVSLDRMSLASLTTAVEQAPAKSDAKPERSQPAPAAASSPTQALIPEAITKPLPLTLHGLAPARGKPAQVFSSALPRPAEIQAPRQNALPLRPVMVLGPAPRLAPDKQAPAAVEAPVKEAPAKPETQPSTAKPRKSEVRVLKLQLPDQPKKGEVRKEEAKPEPVKKEAAAETKPAETKPDAKPDAKPEFKLDIRRVPAQQVSPQKVESKPAPAKTPVPTPAVTAKKETPVESKPPAKETKAPAAEAVKPKAAEAAKGTKESLAPPAKAATPSKEPDLLGLPKLSLEPQGNFWTNLPAAARIGIAAGVLAAIIGGIFLTSKGSSAPRTAEARGTHEATVVEAGPPIGNDSGWATDWFADRPGARQPRHVDVLNGSLALRDYRIEFEGQIDQQALGWVFRANNKSNFYVEKVQIVSPGLSPIVALIKFAVIDGKEQPREQVPIAFKAHLDTLYKIRTDVVGHQFTTWVQDEKVDTWTDSRIDGGGVGLYYDNGDSAKLKGTITVIPLKVR